MFFVLLFIFFFVIYNLTERSRLFLYSIDIQLIVKSIFI